jgi:SAM-dependent methyltransferase
VSDRWDEGGDYERFMGRWSAPIAERFVEWLGVAPGSSWLDVGCGTGALLRSIAVSSQPTRLAGVDPSERFLASASATLPADADLRVGDAARLPFDDGAFDVIVSGLVLNFVPDPEAAVAEMRRACRRGGVIAAYVWDYADGMQFLRHFWDVATELDRDAIPLDEGRSRFPLSRPAPLSALFESAGLADVETTALEVERTFASFDDYWQPFLGGQGPAGAYVMQLPEPRRAALASELRDRLPISPDRSITLLARAWAVRGIS